ncbi:MAG: AAA family ATPase [Myxococcales bacterium]|nr:AAA family ATPase [Myxococcales bacterium]
MVRLHDLIVREAVGWFSMELVTGVDFVAAHADARGVGGVALTRRFAALAPMLVDALQAVHAAGFLHGDLKPENVLVELGERVVLLDFGMAATVDLDDRLRGDGVGGTLAYLPPEALDDPRPSLAWDTYALGLLFVEALTGRPPFAAELARALVEKRRGLPATVRRALAGLSPTLAECVGGLLDARPEARPSLAEVSRWIGAPARHAVRANLSTELVGRDEPLAALRRWSASEGFSACVLRGVSGIGKSSLARALVRELRARGELVLRARCHPNESVPFNGLDGILDDLVRCIGDDEARDHSAIAALAAVFPAFAQLGVPDDVPARGEPPHEILARACEALLVVLTAVARHRRVVLWIDDLQWADGETRGILRSWAESFKPPVHLLLSTRSGPPEYLAVDLDLELHPLLATEAAALVRRVAPDLPEPVFTALYGESAGIPFILQRLARASAAGPDRPAPTLVSALYDALAGLADDGERAALLLALAGRPLELDLLAAAGVRRGTTFELERRGVATRGADGHHRFEVQHARLASALLAAVPLARQIEGHAALAAALIDRGRGEDAPHIATHLRAGERPDAVLWAARAGERLAAGFALESAALWYRRALEWSLPDDPARFDRRLALAHALAAAGHGVEAGDEFAACAAGAPHGAAREYRQKAAEHYLAAGAADRGMAALRPLLSARRIAWPESQASAAAGILVRLVRIAIRSARPSRGELPDSALDLDLCWAAAKGLLGTDAVRGAFFALEALDRALQGSDVRRLARHRVAVAAIVFAPLGGRLAALGRRWIADGVATAATERDPYLAGFARVCEGQLAVIEGRWPEAHAVLTAGLAQLRADGVGAHWEQHIGLMGLLRTLQERREFAALRIEASGLRARAEGLGDLYAEVTGRLYEALGQLSLRQTVQARFHVERALARWGRREALDIQQLYAEHILAICDAVDGDALAAWRRVSAAWPEWRRSQLLRIPVARIDCLALRARVALCAANRDPAARAAYVAACLADARSLRREARPDARALGEQLAALSRAPVVDLAALFPTHIAPAASGREEMP